MRQYKRVRSQQGKGFSYNQIKNVYLIVIYERSPKAFKELPTEYYHYGRQVFHTGLQLNMLQEFVMIPLDIFHKIKDNNTIDNKLDAWLTFLSDDRPDKIVELISEFPEFKPMYETLYQMCQNVERVMEMFSEELRIMDRNTVKYMIEEQQQEIESQQKEIESQQQEIESQQQEIESQQQEIRDLSEKLEVVNGELAQERRKVIVNMLQADMAVESIAKLVECNISYVEEVKKETIGIERE